MSRRWFVGLLVVAELLTVAGWATFSDRWTAFLVGDCPYYAFAAESLLADGDFELANQLAPGKTRAELAEGLRRHDTFFALGADGRIVPKLSTLLPILSAPFRAALGTAGFLVFNCVQVFVLVYGVSVLAGDTPSARVLALAGYLLSPLVPFTFNFSPDMLGAALIVWAFVAADRRRWAACGVLAGLAVWAKVYLAAVVLPVGLLVLAGGRRAVAVAVLGGLVGVAPLLASNAVFFGHPLTTGYDREGHVTPAGELVTADHYSRFNQPVLTGLLNLLFDTERMLGAVWTAPVWALWPVGAWFAWRAGRRLWAAALGLGVVANLLVFAPYDMWEASVNGNRFLFPAVALGVAVQGPLWARVLRPRVELGVVEQVGER